MRSIEPIGNVIENTSDNIEMSDMTDLSAASLSTLKAEFYIIQ